MLFDGAATARAVVDTVQRWLSTCTRGADPAAPITVVGMRRTGRTDTGSGVGHAWAYVWTNSDTGEKGEEYVGVGRLGGAVTLTVFAGPAAPGSRATPSETMLGTALSRLVLPGG